MGDLWKKLWGEGSIASVAVVVKPVVGDAVCRQNHSEKRGIGGISENN